MTLFFDVLTSLLAAFGLVCLAWLAFGYLVVPIGGAGTPTRAVISGTGRGEGLEQTVRGLLWLHRTGLWRGNIRIEDEGLDPEGTALARRLASHLDVEFQSTVIHDG